MSEKHRSSPTPLEPKAAPLNLITLTNRLLARLPEERPSGEEILSLLQRETAQPSTAPAAHAPSPSPLVGRDTELAMMLDFYQRRSPVDPTLLMLSGISGMGKSRLLESFLDKLSQSAEPPIVIRGRALEQELVPFKSLDSSLDHLTRRLRRSSLKLNLSPQEQAGAVQCFPVLAELDLGAPAPSHLPPLGPTRMRRRGALGIRRIFQTLTSHAPVIWVIDDLQWGDNDSVRLLQEIFEAPGAPPVFFCLAHRSEYETPPLEGLSSWVRSHPKAHRAKLELEGLDDEDASALVSQLSAMHEAPPEHVPVEQIVREAKGIPFHIGELTRWVLSAPRCPLPR